MCCLSNLVFWDSGTAICVALVTLCFGTRGTAICVALVTLCLGTQGLHSFRDSFLGKIW